MKLEWFRQHKKIVYWILLPVVGMGMAFFGVSTAIEKSHGRKGGPSVTYRVGTSERYMNPAEVLALRATLTRFYKSNRDLPSVEAALHQVFYQNSNHDGFDLGENESREELKQQIRSQVRMREGTDLGDVKDWNKIYGQLLKATQLTPEQFKRMTEENAVMGRYMQYMQSQLKVSDEQLFLDYVKDKEVARLRYQELKSEDYVAKTTPATDDKIKDFYEKNKSNVKEMKDVMFTKPKLSADVLLFDTQALFGNGELKPTDEELKTFFETVKKDYVIAPKAGEPAPAAGAEKYKAFDEVKGELEKKWKEAELKSYYERYKPIHWKVALKPGEKQEGEVKYKPFEEVKAEVETKWKDDEKRRRPITKMNTLKTELQDAEQAHQREQGLKKEAEQKPFDLAAWAKSRNLMLWTTAKLTEEEFRAGKEELNAPNAKWAANLFYLKSETNNRWLAENNKRKEKEFSDPQVFDKGAVITRIKEYSVEEVKPLEEAKPAIVARMQVLDAIELARTDAKKMKDEWAAGNNLPDLEKLNEVRGDSANRQPILQEFFGSPKAIGEVLDVAEGPVDQNNPNASPHRRLYVGFAVERELPSRDGFHQDTAWSREDHRDQIARMDFRSVQQAFEKRLRDMGQVIYPGGDTEDPPLSDEMRRGGPSDDDGM
jgi:hypothetical protein